MAYQFSKDITITPAAGNGVCDLVWAIKELLKTAGWTCVGSGTGTGGTYDTSDLITTAAILNASVGDKAYVILQKPGSTFQVSFQRVESRLNFRMKITPTGFAAPAAADATPAAADQVVLCGSGTDASPTGAQWMNNVNTYRGQMAADNAAPYTWYFFAHQAGTTTVNASGFLDAMKAGSYPAEDTQPWIMGLNLNGTGSWTIAALQTAYDVPNVYGNACGYMSATLSAANYKYILAETGYGVPGNLGTNQFNGKDDALEITYARPTFAGTLYGVKGIGTMAKWMGTTRALSSTLSISGTRDRYCIGNCSLPWDGSVPNL